MSHHLKGLETQKLSKKKENGKKTKKTIHMKDSARSPKIDQEIHKVKYYV